MPLALAAAVVIGVYGAGVPLPAEVTSHTWTLRQMTLDTVSQPLPTDRGITLQFHPTTARASGSSGCNAYDAHYTSPLTRFGGGLRFSDSRVTLMACFPASVMTVEGQYLTALGQVDRYTLSGQTLTLTDADGRVALVFTPR